METLLELVEDHKSECNYGYSMISPGMLGWHERQTCLLYIVCPCWRQGGACTYPSMGTSPALMRPLERIYSSMLAAFVLA